VRLLGFLVGMALKKIFPAAAQRRSA